MPKTKVLVVEDERVIGLEIERRLEQLDYDVLDLVTAGEDAVAVALEKSPDLILMDIVLRGEIDGIEAAKQIRAKIDVPIIFLTAHADDQTLERAKISEPFGYIVKPFKARELHVSIEMGLYKHKMEKKLRLSEERLRLLIESAEDIITVQDLSGKFLYFNGADRYGISSKEVVGKMPADLLNPELAQSLTDQITQVASSGKGAIVEVDVNVKDEVIWFNAHLYPLKDRAGQINSVAIIARNITEAKRLKGLLPVCAWCGKKIQDEHGHWQPLDVYIATHTEAQVTHSICDRCLVVAESELEAQ